MNRRQIGNNFEELAANFLKQNNFEIISRNTQSIHKETDIICRKQRTIHFVEVKGRNNKSFGEITETISKKKKENLIIAAEMWLKENELIDCDWQIDFLGIYFENKKEKFLFIENAINEL